MADAQILGGGSSGQPGDGAASDGNQPIERRQNRRSGDSPAEIVKRLPALVVLERIPVPTLAVGRDGFIVFANTAFAEMVGHQQDRLAGSAFHEVFKIESEALSALSDVGALANHVVELRHREGWTVRAKMSKSALMRHDDPVVLVAFENLTERLWIDKR